MDLIIDIIKYISQIILNVFRKLTDLFLDLNIFEKINLINFIPAFFAIILPVAKYYIFEQYFRINNPLAVYLIGIIFVMAVTQFFKNRISFIIREIVNAYYLFWVIFLHFYGGLSKAPYTISVGYFINLFVPIIFMIFSFLSYRFYDN